MFNIEDSNVSSIIDKIGNDQYQYQDFLTEEMENYGDNDLPKHIYDNLDIIFGSEKEGYLYLFYQSGWVGNSKVFEHILPHVINYVTELDLGSVFDAFPFDVYNSYVTLNDLKNVLSECTDATDSFGLFVDRIKEMEINRSKTYNGVINVVDNFLTGLFDRYDGYFECLESTGVEITGSNVLIIGDKKYRVGLYQI